MVAITMVFPLDSVCIEIVETIKTLKTDIIFMASKSKFMNLVTGYIMLNEH